MSFCRLLVLPLLLASPLLAEGPADAAATITGPELKKHVEVLASDDFEGRGTGSAGERKAAEYLIAAHRAAGLEPGGEDGTFLQPFDVPGDSKLIGEPLLHIQIGSWWKELKAKVEFTPFGFTSSGELEAPLVFAGYGVVDEKRHYDDFAGLDVKGKVVLVLRNQPRPGEAEGREHATFASKAKHCKDRGAAALIVVNDTLHTRQDGLVPFGGGEDAGLPCFHVKKSVAASLFKLAGRDLAGTQKAIDDKLQPGSFELQGKVKLAVKVERDVLHARNVVARLAGSDPALAKEVVVIGAHYDHLGHGHTGQSLDPKADEQIHNGADDNASGTAGLLELAQAMAQAHPRRTVYFVSFSGEEMGLLGSAHFVAHPPVPIERIVAMVNLDMIGRLNKEKLEIGGVGSSPGFPELVQRVCSTAGFKLKPTKSGFGPSDHASFYGAKVPVLFFFTGLHGDYHRPSDDADKIEAGGMERVSKAAFACAIELANADKRPDYSPPANNAGRDADRPRLGVMLDPDSQERGATLGEVLETGPAGLAGLKAGDVILSIAGRALDENDDLVAALSEHKVGDEVEVRVQRDTEQLTVKVKLGGR